MWWPLRHGISSVRDSWSHHKPFLSEWSPILLFISVIVVNAWQGDWIPFLTFGIPLVTQLDKSKNVMALVGCIFAIYSIHLACSIGTYFAIFLSWFTQTLLGWFVVQVLHFVVHDCALALLALLWQEHAVLLTDIENLTHSLELDALVTLRNLSNPLEFCPASSAPTLGNVQLEFSRMNLSNALEEFCPAINATSAQNHVFSCTSLLTWNASTAVLSTLALFALGLSLRAHR
jgi:hypothetical protein